MTRVHHEALLASASAGVLTCDAPESAPPQRLVPITQWSRKLRELTGQEGPGYRTLYNRMLDDKLGVEVVRVNGRIHAREADLSIMAVYLGLMPSAEAAPRADAVLSATAAKAA